MQFCGWECLSHCSRLQHTAPSACQPWQALHAVILKTVTFGGSSPAPMWELQHMDKLSLHPSLHFRLYQNPERE